MSVWEHTPRMTNGAGVPPVMPAQAGIHDLPACKQTKSWMPAFSGITGWITQARNNRDQRP
jgi:hypothetical protein